MDQDQGKSIARVLSTVLGKLVLANDTRAAQSGETQPIASEGCVVLAEASATPQIAPAVPCVCPTIAHLLERLCFAVAPFIAVITYSQQQPSPL